MEKHPLIDITNDSAPVSTDRNRYDAYAAAQGASVGANWASAAANREMTSFASLLERDENRGNVFSASSKGKDAYRYEAKADVQETYFANWASAAANKKMTSFASLSGGDENHGSLFSAGDKNKETLIGPPQLTTTTTTTTTTETTSFGQPDPVMRGFSAASAPSSEPQKLEFAERCLEDLYNEYPNKKLRGLEKEHLQPAVMVLEQVVREATLAWIQTWCPLMNWDKIHSSLVAGTAKHMTINPNKEDPSPATNTTKAGKKGKDNRHLVPEEALDSSRGNIQTVMDLFQRCAKLPPQPDQLRDLVGIVDDCMQLCRTLRDKRRTAQLAKTRQVVQWVALGLDCKKLDIYREAARQLRANDAKYQVVRETHSKVAVTRFGAQLRGARLRAEGCILDRAAAAFEPHREDSYVQLLRAMEELLSNTAEGAGKQDGPGA